MRESLSAARSARSTADSIEPLMLPRGAYQTIIEGPARRFDDKWAIRVLQPQRGRQTQNTWAYALKRFGCLQPIVKDLVAEDSPGVIVLGPSAS
jgi:hypothetical protein